MNNNKQLVAVYGSLRSGLSNHSVLFSYTGTTEFLGYDKIKGWDMYSYGAFPFIVKGDGDVLVEVYEVSSDTLTGPLDSLEGYPTFYNRQQVDTCYGRAWVYYIEDDSTVGQPKVEDGDWVKFIAM